MPDIAEVVRIDRLDNVNWDKCLGEALHKLGANPVDVVIAVRLLARQLNQVATIYVDRRDPFMFETVRLQYSTEDVRTFETVLCYESLDKTTVWFEIFK